MVELNYYILQVFIFFGDWLYMQNPETKSGYGLISLISNTITQWLLVCSVQSLDSLVHTVCQIILLSLLSVFSSYNEKERDIKVLMRL